MAPINVGLLGYGNASRVFHLPFILPHKDVFNLVAICQRSDPVDGKAHCTVDFPHVKWYKDVDEFVADPKIELVLVVTPHGNDLHYSSMKTALLANKHGGWVVVWG